MLPSIRLASKSYSFSLRRLSQATFAPPYTFSWKSARPTVRSPSDSHGKPCVSMLSRVSRAASSDATARCTSSPNSSGTGMKRDPSCSFRFGSERKTGLSRSSLASVALSPAIRLSSVLAGAFGSYSRYRSVLRSNGTSLAFSASWLGVFLPVVFLAAPFPSASGDRVLARIRYVCLERRSDQHLLHPVEIDTVAHAEWANDKRSHVPLPMKFWRMDRNASDRCLPVSPCPLFDRLPMRPTLPILCTFSGSPLPTVVLRERLLLTYFPPL